MVDVKQIRKLVVTTLKGIEMYSKAAENLIMGTGAVESGYRYIQQLGSGPAVSFFQCEGATISDNIHAYLSYRPERFELICDVSITPKSSKLMKYDKEKLAQLALQNIAFAVCMTRVKYWRVPKKLPGADDVEGLASYWKAHYNTALGKGTEKKFIEAYELVS